ncbi:MAG: hypothetical protein GY807_22820, partial [Gammaproteobacteria bacterium]|nr:hypothetical protein [Gammaproteobacteria bacterium]
VIHRAFTWKANRKADKAGVFSLHGVKFQVDATLAGSTVTVHYDPECLHEVEVHHPNAGMQRLMPFEVAAWRRPKAPPNAPVQCPTPKVDYLAHLVAKYQQGNPESSPQRQHWAQQQQAQRNNNTNAIITIMQDNLHDGVVDISIVRNWLARYGPLDPSCFEAELTALLERHPNDLHVRYYLEQLREVS